MALNLPILVTEQYPKALGSTVSELQSVLPDKTPIFAKSKFSMCGVVPQPGHLPSWPMGLRILLISSTLPINPTPSV